MDTVLKLFKIALGITHDKRDEYYTQMLEARKAELEEKGVSLNLSQAEDQILLCDYAEWMYRKRTEDVPLAQNLQWRIRNRIVKGRANHGT